MCRVGKDQGDNVKLVIGKREVFAGSRAEVGSLAQSLPCYIQHLVRRIDTRYTAPLSPEETKIISLPAPHVEQSFAIRGSQEPQDQILLASIYVICGWRT